MHFKSSFWTNISIILGNINNKIVKYLLWIILTIALIILIGIFEFQVVLDTLKAIGLVLFSFLFVFIGICISE